MLTGFNHSAAELMFQLVLFFLTLLNLAGEQQFKWENILVVGIVPDMDTM